VELLTQKIHGIKKSLQQQQDALRDKENETSFAINNLTQERDQLSSKSKILDDTLQRYAERSLCPRKRLRGRDLLNLFPLIGGAERKT
jgi:hypothetical protein